MKALVIIVVGLSLSALAFGVGAQSKRARRLPTVQALRAAYNKEPAAIDAWKRGDLKKAEAIYREIDAVANNGYTKYKIAMILRDEGRLKEAKSLMDGAMVQDSHHAWAFTNPSLILEQYADLCFRTGDLVRARAILAKMGAKNWYQADLTAGDAARDERDFAEQERVYRDALTRRPNDPAAKFLLARAEKEAAVQRGAP